VCSSQAFGLTEIEDSGKKKGEKGGGKRGTKRGWDTPIATVGCWHGDNDNSRDGREERTCKEGQSRRPKEGGEKITSLQVE